jgi:transposase InsO family protein
MVDRDVTIEPRQEALVPGRLQATDHRLLQDQLMTEQRSLSTGLNIARVILPLRCRNLPLRVLNTTDRPVTLRNGEELTTVESVVVGPKREGPAADPENHISPVMDTIEAELSPTQREVMRCLLAEYADVFSQSEYDLGRTNILQHRIDTGDARPVRQPLRRQPLSRLQVVDEHLDQMMEQGIIEPSCSPWASNVVVCTKKDGSTRFCIDYRQLNDVTVKDAYPLPRITDCLDALSGATYFSAFDLRSGYHQVELEPNSRDKTSFVTRRGTFSFKTMPFGLANAPATFQRVMDVVLSGLNLNVCLVYLDDIIVFSRTVEDHMDRLRALFDRLRSANLKLKPSKCQLLKLRVEFLGHVVSARGIETDPKKIDSVSQWPTPCNLGELRSFVGLCSYYRRYVKDFATIASPLHELTRKNAKFLWTESCHQAFDELKRRLTTAPVLAMPDDEGTYILDTDASNQGIGAVLSQIQAGEERVVAFASRVLSGPERNYCATRKELLAVVTYMKHFRPYLLGGRVFTIRTDHAALQWLRRTPEPVGQQARWLEIMEEFQPFVIQHRPGLRHTNADALSRIPCRQCQHENETPHFVEIRSLEVQAGEDDPDQWSTNSVAAATRTDDTLRPFTELFERYGNDIPWEAVAAGSKETKSYWNQRERMRIREGVLYRLWESADGLQHRWVMVLPSSLQPVLLSLAHTGATGGHMGIKRTQHQVQLRAYWMGWREDVARFCRQCEACSRFHHGALPRQGELQPTKVGEPLERMAIDLCGPFPASRQGHVYILTAIDLFSKWAEAVPLRNKEATTVARALLNNVFLRMGMPQQLLSDRGTEFENGLMRELCLSLGIDKVRTTAYKPSTNGCVERLHRTLHSMLGKVVDDNQRDWDEHLPSIMAAYRASPSEATGYSPNFLMFGREVRAPVDLVCGAPREEEELWRNYDGFVDHHLTVLRKSYERAREQLGQVAERAKDRYDMRARETELKVGQWVWVYNPRRRVGRSPKWQRLYEGPCLVTRVLKPVNVVVQQSRRSNPRVVHIDKVKPVLGPTPVSWLGTNNTAEDGEPRNLVPRVPVQHRESNDGAENGAAKPLLQRSPIRRHTTDNSATEVPLRRPSRKIVRPRHLHDYVSSRTTIAEGRD